MLTANQDTQHTKKLNRSLAALMHTKHELIEGSLCDYSRGSYASL